MSLRRSRLGWPSVGLSIVALVALSACGSSSKSTSSSATTSGAQGSALSLSISESGNAATYAAPASIAGGLVKISFTNNGKSPHGAQLIEVLGNHTPRQALRALGSSNKPKGKTPSYLRAAGGPAAAGPGQTSTGTVNLVPGKYLIADAGGASNGPPAYTQLTVTGGTPGPLPGAPATVTATAPSKDHYKWSFSGAAPVVGANRALFVSKGHNTLHLFSAFRVVGHPSKAQLIKFLSSNSSGPPPAFVDQSSGFVSSAALDSARSQVTSVTFAKPGKWVFFCPLHDRDGGKPHFEEGLLTTITVH